MGLARSKQGGAHSVLVGKPEGNGQRERPSRRWENIIIFDIQEVGWGQ
jgi:hypothetical protein